jgi:hypothetical protein
MFQPCTRSKFLCFFIPFLLSSLFAHFDILFGNIDLIQESCMLFGEEEWPSSPASVWFPPFIPVLAPGSASRKICFKIFMGAQRKTDTARKLLELVWSIGYTHLLFYTSMEPSRRLVVPISLRESLDYLIFLEQQEAFFCKSTISLYQLKDPLSSEALISVIVKAKQSPLASFLLSFSSLHTTFGTYFMTTAITLLQS